MQPQPSEQAGLNGYELFRRAIEERDGQAWAEGTMRYRPLLLVWAGRCSANATISTRREDIVDYAFARAWTALSSKHFARFPTLAALLAYLRACVTTAVIDCARNEMKFDRLDQTIEAEDLATPEQIVLDQFDRGEIWRIANSIAQTEQEQRVLRRAGSHNNTTTQQRGNAASCRYLWYTVCKPSAHSPRAICSVRSPGA